MNPELPADYGRLLPWLILAFTLGWLVFFGALWLIVKVVS